MKKILIILLKTLLLVLLLVLTGGLTFALVLWMGWPWWVGLCFIAVYFVLYCAWILVRKILLRRREQSFVNEVIAKDEKYRQSLGDNDGSALELQTAWKEAINTLNRSKLGKSGNPLYILPWYMIIGESGSGKSTAIRSAKLSGPFAEVKKTSGLGSTRNCDWWFFEQAVVLDTAGRYAIPLDEGRDRQEWQTLLSLLVKYRKHEALNGLIVTVAADNLLHSSEEKIVQDGQNIRQRVDELMRVLGIKFPVYVLVTKCDLIQGMTDFCENLPEKSLNQVMGLLNQELSRDVNQLADNLFHTITEKLRQLRVLLLSGGQHAERSSSTAKTGLLLFPDEFSGIKERLQLFTEAAFKENPYQETPLLRGIYFSSGRQEGAPYSLFLQELGLIRHQDVVPESSRGFFLHDLFSKVMPGDRHLYAPTGKALAWGRFTRNIGLTAWAVFFLALCGLLSFSFIKNLTTLKAVADAFEQPVTLQGEVLTDIAIMERYQHAISDIEQANHSWWFPRFGLEESLDVEARIKGKYCARFHREFVTDFDKQLEIGATGLSAQSSEIETAQFVVHITHRINLIKSRLNGHSYDHLAEMAKPSFQHFLSSADSRLVNQLSQRISEQYIHYLAWQANDAELRNELRILQRQLHHILSLPDTNLNWLTVWINRQGELDYLDLEFFWGAILEQNDLTTVPPAFTQKGYKAIQTLLGQIEDALPDRLVLSANKTRFITWYKRAYKQIWFDFARTFPQAEYYLKSREAWRQAAAGMALDKGPYLNLIQVMSRELGILDNTDKTKDDSWITLLNTIEKIRIQAKSEKAIEEQKSMIAKVTKKGKKVISKIEKGVGRIEKKMGTFGAGSGDSMETILVGASSFNDYRKALSDLVLVTSSRNLSFKMTSEIFTQDPATSEAAMYLAQRQLIKMKKEISIPGTGKETMVIWRLIGGPLTFLRDYAFLEAACNLNRLWEEDVLVEIQNIFDKSELNKALFEENGLAIGFIKGVASPFLNRSLEKGFYPNTALGRMLPFRDEFLRFLSEGIRLAHYKPDIKISDEVPLFMKNKNAVQPQSASQEENPIPPKPELQSSYTVVLEASPTSTNKGARVVPHAVSLELTCGADIERLVNLQYPVRKKLVWKPKTCERLSLKIEVGSLVLEKKYEDEYSFARFVNEYKDGSVVYTPLDFSANKGKQLKRLNIRTITVRFKAGKGGEPLVRLMEQLEAHNKALGLKEQKNKGREQNMAEAMMALENRRKAEALENEAMKKAWKAKQLARAAEIKKQWEEQLPDVPRDITVCWE